MEKQYIKYILKGKNYNFSTWEIGGLLQELNSFYYKSELENTFLNLLVAKVEPKNMIIFSKDVFENKSVNLHKVFDIKEVKYYDLLSLGTPISYQPNYDIKCLNSTFIILKEINRICSSFHLRTFMNFKFYDLYRQLYEKKYDHFYTFCINICINNLQRSSYLTKTLKFELMDLIDLKNQLKKNNINDISILKEGKFKNIFFKHYKEHTKEDTGQPFIQLFKDVKNPILATFDEKRKKFNFLCTDLIYKNNKNTNLKILHLKQNSPIEFLLLGLIAFAGAFKSMLEVSTAIEDLKIKKIKKENALIEQQTLLLQQKEASINVALAEKKLADKLEVDKINADIEIMESILTFYDNYNLKISQLKHLHEYAQYDMAKIKEDLQRKISRILEKYELTPTFQLDTIV